LAADLLKAYEAEIEVVSLIPADGGRFEVTVNQRQLYSKLKTHRHPDPGEVLGLLRAYLKEVQ
jgi:selenoprotein W-related protein